MKLQYPLCPAGFLGLNISGEAPNCLLLVNQLLEQGMSVVPPPHFTLLAPGVVLATWLWRWIW